MLRFLILEVLESVILFRCDVQFTSQLWRQVQEGALLIAGILRPNFVCPTSLPDWRESQPISLSITKGSLVARVQNKHAEAYILLSTTCSTAGALRKSDHNQLACMKHRGLNAVRGACACTDHLLGEVRCMKLDARPNEAIGANTRRESVPRKHPPFRSTPFTSQIVTDLYESDSRINQVGFQTFHQDSASFL